MSGNQVYLKMAKYLQKYYPGLLADIIEDSRMKEECPPNGIVYVAESMTGYGSIWKIGKSYNQGRIYQLDRTYNVGTAWQPVHIIYCRHGNDVLEKSLHYLFYDCRTLEEVSRELFVLAPEEITWLKSINYVDEARLEYLIGKTYADAKRLYPYPNRL